VSNSESNTSRKCYFCQAEEGKPRILGGFIVELREVQLKNGEEVYACQSCSVHERKNLKNGEQKKKGLIKKVKAYFS
jgi:hypothetical protein|tara:strand:- start:513 stop:743 length:231 start_codon:yes stop_codon:yes gene_type:complete